MSRILKYENFLFERFVSENYSFGQEVRFEAMSFELPNSGGTIVFSADLNATLANAETFSDRIKSFFTSRIKTLFNRMNIDDRLKSILLDRFKVVGYTIGRGLKGFYTAQNGLQFDEKSYSVDLAGIDSNTLLLIATEICKEFGQEAVLVKDYNGERVKIYLADGEYVDVKPEIG